MHQHALRVCAESPGAGRMPPSRTHTHARRASSRMDTCPALPGAAAASRPAGAHLRRPALPARTPADATRQRRTGQRLHANATHKADSPGAGKSHARDCAKRKTSWQAAQQWGAGLRKPLKNRAIYCANEYTRTFFYFPLDVSFSLAYYGPIDRRAMGPRDTHENRRKETDDEQAGSNSTRPDRIPNPRY
jgi:hypothetical protein